MHWMNIKLIMMREIRDQLRDRRTLFMIAVLPLLLYPLLGMSFFQVTQFMREHVIRVLVVGAPESDQLPPLLQHDAFSGDLFAVPDDARLLQLTTMPTRSTAVQPEVEQIAQARRDMQEGNFDVVVYFPANFAERFAKFRESLAAAQAGTPSAKLEAVPRIEIYPHQANDAAKAAHRRVVDVLDSWREKIGRRNLEESHLPATAAKPFQITTLDVAAEGQHKAAVWSKILPFVLLLWALTGAFYPAIDLCAGEKERGTLETLLSSPAERIEIVWGKLLTVMLFSIATAMLNLLSLTITGSLVLSQLPNLGPPPPLAIVWLLIALLPVSALFSALCLALAAFARSNKEGQYYLMPLVLVTMPLVILPMAPGVELNAGNALVPVTGVVLLLRSMLEGNYLEALPYVPLVAAMTLICCWLAIRWATNQFNSEEVLFRESERWDVGLWIKHLMRDREGTPSFSEAMFCGVLILLIRFFINFSVNSPETFRDLAVLAAMTQLVVVLTPALLMTVMLTRSPSQTLLLRRPPFAASLAAIGLAFAVHPTANLLQAMVMRLYPLNNDLERALASLNFNAGNLWVTILVIAVLPAVCEELAFRGFILSGFRRMGHKWAAIVLTSIFFGATHSIFQQSMVACALGMLLGFIAVQTGSLLPCVLFHAVHNSLSLLIGRLAPTMSEDHQWLTWLVREGAQNQLYHWPVVCVSIVLSGVILAWFHRLAYTRTPEESLQEAIDHHAANWQAG
jgi:sodium transport system permease protein